MKHRKSLKQRIFAITAMLLVSAIVLGTTSYAWIVMSTRPEAGKISTTVGSNGSLEIALATPEHMKELIANNMNVVDGYSGFSTGDALVDNTLWGNVLDLSDKAYGLSSLIMKPTALNVENNTLKYAPIITAMYGTDGRITFLTDYSASAGYDPASRSFLVSENIPYGVRVAGLTADAALRAEIYGLLEHILYGEEYDEEDWEHDNVEDFLINCTDLILDVEYFAAETSERYTLEYLGGLLAEFAVIMDQLAALAPKIESFEKSLDETVEIFRDTYDKLAAAREASEIALAKLATQDPLPTVLTLEQVKTVFTPLFGEGLFRYWFEAYDVGPYGYSNSIGGEDTDHTFLGTEYAQRYQYFTIDLPEETVAYWLHILFWIYGEGFDTSYGKKAVRWEFLNEIGDNERYVYSNGLLYGLCQHTPQQNYVWSLSDFQTTYENMAFYELGTANTAKIIIDMATEFVLTHAAYSRIYGTDAEESYDSDIVRDGSVLYDYLETLKDYLDVVEDYVYNSAYVYAYSLMDPERIDDYWYACLYSSEDPYLAWYKSESGMRAVLLEAGGDVTLFDALLDEVKAQYDAIYEIEQAIGQMDLATLGYRIENGKYYYVYYDMTYEQAYMLYDALVDLDTFTVGGYSVEELGSHLEEVIVDSLDTMVINGDDGILSTYYDLVGEESALKVTLNDAYVRDTANAVYLPGNDYRVYVLTDTAGSTLVEALQSCGVKSSLVSSDYDSILADAQAKVNALCDTELETVFTEVLFDAIMEYIVTGATNGYSADYITGFSALISGGDAKLLEMEDALKSIMLLYAAGHTGEGENYYSAIKGYVEDGMALATIIDYNSTILENRSFASVYERFLHLIEENEQAKAALDKLAVYGSNRIRWADLYEVVKSFVELSPSVFSVDSDGKGAPAVVKDSFFLDHYGLFAEAFDDPEDRNANNPYITGIDTDVPADLEIGVLETFQRHDTEFVKTRPESLAQGEQMIQPMYANTKEVFDRIQVQCLSDRDFVYKNSEELADSYASLVRHHYNTYKAQEPTFLQMVADAVRSDADPTFGYVATRYRNEESESFTLAVTSLNEALIAYEEYLFNALMALAASDTTDVEVYIEAVNCETAAELLTLLGLSEGTPQYDSYVLMKQIEPFISNAALAAETYAEMGLLSLERVRIILDFLFDFSTATVNDQAVSAYISSLSDWSAASAQLETAGVTFHVESAPISAVMSLFDTSAAGSRSVVLNKMTVSNRTNSMTDVYTRFLVDYVPTMYLAKIQKELLGYSTYGNDYLPTLNEDSANLLADTYCFAIDLLFKTNAEDSHLILQTEATLRVDNGNDLDLSYQDTMGGGSYLNIEDDIIRNGLTIAFTDTVTGEVYAYAYAGKDGKLNLASSNMICIDGDEEIPVITDLEQNVVKAITMWVYLDGERITNMDAAAEVVTKMDMNIQFASTAELHSVFADDNPNGSEKPDDPNDTEGPENPGGSEGSDDPSDSIEPIEVGPVSNLHFELADNQVVLAFDYPEGITGSMDDVLYDVSMSDSAADKNFKRLTNTNSFLLTKQSRLTAGTYDKFQIESEYDDETVATVTFDNLELVVNDRVNTSEPLFVRIDPTSEMSNYAFTYVITGLTPNTPFLLYTGTRAVSLGYDDGSEYSGVAVGVSDANGNITADLGASSAIMALKENGELGSELTKLYFKVVECTDPFVSADGMKASYTQNLRCDWTLYVPGGVGTDVDQSGTFGDNISWSYSPDGTLRIAGTGAMPDPESGYPWSGLRGLVKNVVIEDGVTTVGNHAFSRFIHLQSVSFGDSITEIGDYAFYQCDDLENFTLPDGLQRIGKCAFRECESITAVDMPDSVVEIGSEAFCFCTNLETVELASGITHIPDTAFGWCGSLKNIVIPEGVTVIGSQAFNVCESLETITLPATLTSVYAYAFEYCRSLTSVYYQGAESQWNQIRIQETGNSELLNASKHFALLAAGDMSNTITWTLDHDGHLTVSGIGAMPDYTYSTEDVPWSAYRMSIKTASISDGITHIGQWSFNGCRNLESIEIPDSVTAVAGGAFRYCEKLIQVEGGVCYVNNWAVDCEDSATAIALRSGTVGVAGNAFSSSSATSIEVPESVKYIGESAFSSCKSLVSIVLPDHITSLGEYAFYGCTSLVSVELPEMLTSIDEYAFQGCTSLANIVLPDNVTRIGERAFYECIGLVSVELPEMLTSIGKYAFCYCDSLAQIIIPSNVTDIEENAFNYCSALTSITVASDNSVYRSEGNCLIQGKTLVRGCVNSVIPTDGSVTRIGDCAFAGCTGLTSIEIPDTIVNIGEYAFVRCINLTSIVIPESVVGINYCTFSGCESLTSVELPETLLFIEHWAFVNCTSLPSITIPKSVEYIGPYAFEDCSKLQTVNYRGTEEDWQAIDVGAYILLGAGTEVGGCTIVYLGE